MLRRALFLGLMLAGAVTAGARELTWVYVIPAVANTLGEKGTDWKTDVTLYNPHDYSLPILIQFLPSNRNNAGGVPSVTVTLAPQETLNLWNVLGPDGFDARGKTGALLIYPDVDSSECDNSACDFAAFSRTYTFDPDGGSGEFGQAIPGFPAALGLDWTVLAYLPQVFNTPNFRTNVGVASWTGTAVTVRVDVQDENGTVIDRSDHYVPAYGHVQWRLGEDVEGGTVVAYLYDGANDAIVYPYASVVNNATGDPAYVEAQHSAVELAAAVAGARAAAASASVDRARPERVAVPTFSVERLRHRPQQER